MSIAKVLLWGTHVGVVSQEPGAPARFQYEPDFLKSGIELSPITMPLSSDIYSFADIGRHFKGLPGLLSDSLPDNFGNSLLDSEMLARGIPPESVTGVDRLCYTGSRGMGALEFLPDKSPRHKLPDEDIVIVDLVNTATQLINERDKVIAGLSKPNRELPLKEIMLIGTSAGGARAKAIIAWNPDTGEIRAGHVPPAIGFEHWIIKFDGVTGNRDREGADPQGYGRIEYAYYLMARAAEISMSECRLLEADGLAHFMTKRFDRENGNKLHMQSLGGLAHLDLTMPRVHSYESAMAIAVALDLPVSQREELLLRAVFNVVARNQDDHVKNMAFLMDRTGTWSLSPAFDVTFAFNPNGAWTGQQQMSVNSKFSGFELSDFEALAKVGLLKRSSVKRAYDRVLVAIARWSEFADRAGVDQKRAAEIQSMFRTFESE